METLRRKLSAYLAPAEIESVEAAYEYSNAAHAGQKRAGGLPFISHPLMVAGILADWKLDAAAVSAALLHDVVEDTAATIDDIRNRFGHDIAHMVDGVTKIDRLDKVDPARDEADSFRKMLIAVAEDLRVILIKLADRLHNLRTLHSIPTLVRRRRIARQSLEIYAPIADRLGLAAAQDEMQNLAFARLHPHRHRVLKKALDNSAANRRRAIDAADSEIEAALAKRGLNALVMRRRKNLYSIYRKMIRDKLSFAEIEDIVGFRLIVPDRESCYRALGVVHEIFQPVPMKFSDYIATPKSNGYQSLHTKVVTSLGVRVEAQIRTARMHEIAENGLAAHWLYKENNPELSRAQKEALARLSSLVKLHADSEDGGAREFLEHVKVDLFPDEIYVLTPRGRIVALPRGASALDFAYAIHTDLGDGASGARVNGQIMPISANLKTGDTVAITADGQGAPLPHWLGYVKTAKARSHIRHVLREKKQSEAAALGRRLFENALVKINPRLRAEAIGDDDWRNYLGANNMRAPEDLFVAIGLGKTLADIAARGVARHSIRQSSARDLRPILIAGAGNTAIELSKCCRPIPPEPIVGLLRKARGLVIHAAQCPQIHGTAKKSEKWIDVAWGDTAREQLYPINVRVEGVNRSGLMSAITHAIGDLGVNIVGCHFGNALSARDTIEIDLCIEVHGIDELDRARAEIERIPLVSGARRLFGDDAAA